MRKRREGVASCLWKIEIKLPYKGNLCKWHSYTLGLIKELGEPIISWWLWYSMKPLRNLIVYYSNHSILEWCLIISKRLCHLTHFWSHCYCLEILFLWIRQSQAYNKCLQGVTSGFCHCTACFLFIGLMLPHETPGYTSQWCMQQISYCGSIFIIRWSKYIWFSPLFLGSYLCMKVS